MKLLFDLQISKSFANLKKFKYLEAVSYAVLTVLVYFCKNVFRTQIYYLSIYILIHQGIFIKNNRS